jgi:cytochrome d ubiquinol oxidase subunit I
VPWVLGLIATRSIDTPVPGINELVAVAPADHRDGLSPTKHCSIKQNPHDASSRDPRRHVADLGYALLLKHPPGYRERDAGQIEAAAAARSPMCRCCSGRSASWWDWASGSSRCSRPRSGSRPPARPLSLVPVGRIAQPAAAVACRELGWIVAEYGRQPWVIEGVLPTALGVSSTDRRQCAVQPDRALRFLFGIARRRSLSAGEIHPARP